MSTHKYIDRICIIGICLSLILMLVFMNGKALGIQSASRVMGYEQRLFDISKVHTIDIIMDDWDGFIATCENKEYTACNVIIDGEVYKNVGIRAKGNTSLSNVSSMDSSRYSFKIEFDQYDSTMSYHGLDKLSLNNLIQDNTMMKDYLTYRLMNEFGVPSPLCSYGYITVNGEDWGLYLAVEGIEEAFLQRNYGNDYGELYKPDNMNMGGGRGGGQNFDFKDFMQPQDENASFNAETGMEKPAEIPTDDIPEGFDPSAMFGEDSESFPHPGDEIPGDFDPTAVFDDIRNPFSDVKGGGGGMGSSETKLQYIDSDPDSYSTIFDSAKTDITEADKERLIQSLKLLNEKENLENAVDMESVIRYFVVHNFVVNEDSYTGSMVHNYYLYEEDGRLSMIPWDYNLAFGSFRSSNAADMVNDPIDTPLSVTGDGDRPMIDWIFSHAEYAQLYHQYFTEFLESIDSSAIINDASALIAPYVEKDPSKFCSYEEFETGVDTLREFCQLRSDSIRGQLDGTIPSTSSEQQAKPSALIDASHITISDMGTMNMDNKGGPKNTDDMNSRSEKRNNDQEEKNEIPQTFEQKAVPSEDDSAAYPPSPDPDMQIPDEQHGRPMEQMEQRENAPTDMPDLPESSPDDSDEIDVPDKQLPSSERMQAFEGSNRQAADNLDKSPPIDDIPSGNDPSHSQNESWLLLGISSLVLLIGLVIVFRFKRRS